MIGLSVSACVRDLAEGKYEERQVKVILGGTRAETDEDWLDVVSRYREVYWRHAPDTCEEMFWRLLSAGKIQQPRVTDSKCPMIGRTGPWVESEDQVEWIWL